jgi:SAM-dependent methyltransferase
LDKLVTTARERFWTPDAWRRDEWVKAQATRLPAGSRVLDAGAGASKYRPCFAHCRYETQDFCQYQGELVKYLQPIDYVCEITRIPLPDATFDAILCTEVLEHVVEPVAVVQEFSRLLKPGGRLWLTTPQGGYVHMEPYNFNSGLLEYWYRHWLPAFGVTVESIAYQGGPARACSGYQQAFYNAWRDWEHTLPQPKRLLSLAARLCFKLPVHYLFPWAAIRFDRHLNPQKVNSGLMVVGVRNGGPDQDAAAK